MSPEKAAHFRKLTSGLSDYKFYPFYFLSGISVQGCEIAWSKILQFAFPSSIGDFDAQQGFRKIQGTRALRYRRTANQRPC